MLRIQLEIMWWRYKNWWCSDGVLKVKTTGLGISDGTVYGDDIKIDYTDNFVLYIINNIIGAESRRRNLYYLTQKIKLCKLDQWFINREEKRLDQLLKTFRIDSIEDIFRSQATLAMQRPLMFNLISLMILKKPNG